MNWKKDNKKEMKHFTLSYFPAFVFAVAETPSTSFLKSSL